LFILVQDGGFFPVAFVFFTTDFFYIFFII